MFKNKISMPLWLLVVFIVLMPLYVAWANTQYRKVAIFNSTIDSTTVGATAPSTGAFTTMQITSGLKQAGVGFKHVRVLSCTTPATTSGFCGAAVVWPTPFADTNYTVTCTLDGALGLGYFIGIGSKTTTQIGYNIQNTPGNTTAVTATIDCIAIHDAT